MGYRYRCKRCKEDVGGQRSICIRCVKEQLELLYEILTNREKNK